MVVDEAAGISSSSPAEQPTGVAGGTYYLATAYPGPYSSLALFERLTSMDRVRRHRRVDNPAEAELILFTDARSDNTPWHLRELRRHPLVRQYPDRCFIYCEHDQPWCAMQGVYTSMPASSFDPRRQRACCYSDNLNHEVEAVYGSTIVPDLLFSFTGRNCHPTRRAILGMTHPRGLIEDTSPHNFFLGRRSEQAEQRKRYAEVIARSKFVLCPRGTASSSFRLYETMAAGRVPVIVSDEWVPPEGPSWESFSLRISEREVDRVARTCEAYEHLWPTMAPAAREAWERYFSQEVFLDRVVEACLDIGRRRQGAGSERWLRHLPSRRRARLAGHHLRCRFRKWRGER